MSGRTRLVVTAVCVMAGLSACSDDSTSRGASLPSSAVTAVAITDRSTSADDFDCPGQSVGIGSPLLLPGAAGAPSPEAALQGEANVIRRQHGELRTREIERTSTSVILRYYDTRARPVGQLRAVRLDTSGWAMDGGGWCSP
jgi:hypothetical protein